MDQVPVRELNQNTAGVLARVQRGETLEITSNGRPVARLLPVASHPLTALVAAGLLRPASRTLDLRVTPADREATSGSTFEGLAREVQQDREDRV